MLGRRVYTLRTNTRSTTTSNIRQGDLQHDTPNQRRQPTGRPPERLLYSPDDVPHMSGRVDLQHAIADGDLVEGGALFVAEERVRNPERLPAALVESDRTDLSVDRNEGQPRVTPRLAQVHAHRVVLNVGDNGR